MKAQKEKQINIDKIAPPEAGRVLIGALGTVMMSKETFDLLAEKAELGEVRAGRTGEE